MTIVAPLALELPNEVRARRRIAWRQCVAGSVRGWAPLLAPTRGRRIKEHGMELWIGATGAVCRNSGLSWAMAMAAMSRAHGAAMAPRKTTGAS